MGEAADKRREESRAKINKTKDMSLDDRVAHFDKVVNEHKIPHKAGTFEPEHQKKVLKILKDDGHEPMMFHHAYNIWESRQRMAAKHAT